MGGEQVPSGALVLDHSLIIEAFLLAKLAAREHEVFAVILLDSERRVIECVETSQGIPSRWHSMTTFVA